MVCARSVIERILNELEPRDAHSIKSLMVGATGVARTQRGYAQIFQRLNPLGKDRSYSGILLKVNAANLAAAVIDIEIPGNFLLAGFKPQRAYRLAIVFRELELVRFSRARHVSKVLLHIAVRAKFTLFLPSPECNPDHAPRLYLESIQNPHDFHCHHGPGSIISRPGCRSPRIQMSPEHHQFILDLGVCAGNFCNSVDSVLVSPVNFTSTLISIFTGTFALSSRYT